MKKWLFPIIALLTVSAISVSALPPPEDDEMNIAEVEQHLFDLDGKIIEIEVTYAYNIEQKSADEYRAFCYYYDTGSYISRAGRSVYFPKEAMEFFKELAEKDYASSSDSFFVQVQGKKLIAVGEKFRKSKGTYSW